MVNKLAYFITLLSLTLHGFAQWTLVREVELGKAPISWASDQQGSIYLGFQDGSLIKLDQHGNEVLNYSLSNQSPITFVDAQYQLKTFLFYFDNQAITILDRFNALPKNYRVADFSTGIASWACPAPDGTFWMIENNPAVLKRIDPIRAITLLEVQPPIGSEVRFMKTLQNLLVILDEEGVNTFDQFGNLLYRFSEDLQSVSLSNDQITCLASDTIYTLDLSSGKQLQSKKTPKKELAGCIQSGQQYAFLKGTKLFVYRSNH